MIKAPENLDGSSFTPRQVRILKISIGIMTGLLILGVIALVYGMARQASRITAKPAPVAAGAAPYSRPLQLGEGEVKAVLADHGLVITHWKGVSGDIIVTLDPQTGQEIGRIEIPHR